MASPVPYLFFLGIPAIGFAAYQSWRKDQRRRQALQTWAGKNGYSYTAEDDRWCERWNGNPFGEGDHRRAKNVITGSAKLPFSAFDYSYQTHSSNGKGGQTTTTHRYVVTSVQLPTFLPQLQVTPENLMTRLGNAFGLDDIELESEDFNRRFRVHARDRKFACDVLTPRTMQMLLSRPALSWRIEGSDVLAWQDGKLSPALCLATTSQLQDIVDGIPSFVWHDREMGGTA